MLDARGISLVAEAADPLPISAMVQGRTCQDAADFLPRIFNLCRAAQSMAACAALNVPSKENATALRGEILRDHVLRLTVILPRHFGQTAMALPFGWQSEPDLLRSALFGDPGKLPDTAQDFESYIATEGSLPRLFAQLRDLFAAYEAAADHLPYVDETNGLDPDARVENSPALRVQEHPVIRAMGDKMGRGPLWRVVARAYDLQALLDGAPLCLSSPSPGVAFVPATRGLYSLTARSKDGLVSSLFRVTPTDHLRAAGGILDQTLARLDPARAGLAPLILDILDPCSAIKLKEVRHA